MSDTGPSCPHCGKTLDFPDGTLSLDLACPFCGKEILPSGVAIPTIDADIKRGSMTITQFMQDRGIDGGVELDDKGKSSTASSILVDQAGANVLYAESGPEHIAAWEGVLSPGDLQILLTLSHSRLSAVAVVILQSRP